MLMALTESSSANFELLHRRVGRENRLGVDYSDLVAEGEEVSLPACSVT
jgi:hypothetical protein